MNYYWRKDGTTIGSETNTTFTIPSTLGSDAATYTLLASNFLGTASTTGAVLTVIVPASITVQPVSQTVGDGSNVTFTVIAAGTAPTYQWFKGSTNIPGATAST